MTQTTSTAKSSPIEITGRGQYVTLTKLAEGEPMTAQRVAELKALAAAALTRGATFVHTLPDGGTASVFYVAGGNFCRVDVRTTAGALLVDYSGTRQWTHNALAELARALTDLG